MTELQKAMQRVTKAQEALVRQTQRAEKARRKQSLKLIRAKMRELGVTLQDLED